MRAVFVAAVVLIAILLVAFFAKSAKEGFILRPRRFRRPWHWYRRPWQLGVGPAPPMWWWRHPGYAAPLELSLPLQNYYGYLHGYPPSSRMPYNE